MSDPTFVSIAVPLRIRRDPATETSSSLRNNSRRVYQADISFSRPMYTTRMNPVALIGFPQTPQRGSPKKHKIVILVMGSFGLRSGRISLLLGGGGRHPIIELPGKSATGYLRQCHNPQTKTVTSSPSEKTSPSLPDT
jgi:hypothetical protein